MKKLLSLAVLAVSLSAGVYATFNVEAKQNANLAFVSSGIVNKVNVDIGSVVKQDDVLATLENSDIKALLDSSETNLKYAKKAFERQDKIKTLIDESKFDGFAKEYENAKSTYAYEQSMYNKTFLKAPFDGVIYSKDIELGNAVSGMMLKTVFQIQSVHERKLVLEFDQKYNKAVKVGQTFQYSVDGDDKVYTGTISKVYPHADVKTRKMMAEVEAKEFTVGLFGDGTINIADEK